MLLHVGGAWLYSWVLNKPFIYISISRPVDLLPISSIEQACTPVANKGKTSFLSPFLFSIIN